MGQQNSSRADLIDRYDVARWWRRFGRLEIAAKSESTAEYNSYSLVVIVMVNVNSGIQGGLPHSCNPQPGKLETSAVVLLHLPEMRLVTFDPGFKLQGKADIGGREAGFHHKPWRDI